MQFQQQSCYHIWLIESDGKLYIRDLYGNSGGVCCAIGLLESNDNYTCKASKPEKVTAEQATTIVKETGTRYIFSKIITDSKNNITAFGVTV